MIPIEPRNPALRRLLQSVVRVESATGVAFLNHEVPLIVTAWHVVKHSPQRVRVVHGSVAYSTPVLRWIFSNLDGNPSAVQLDSIQDRWASESLSLESLTSTKQKASPFEISRSGQPK